jgi:leader peptidase (prepilin peptidase) / N-methyltransferase
MATEAWFWPVLLGALGLVLGSFIATLAIRWPQGRTLGGRSACDGCGKPLAAHELVPVLSYCVQRGRCRGCGAAVRPSHLAIELIAAGTGVAAGIAAPGVQGAAGAVFGWLLLTLAALDLAAFWLPNLLTGLLAAMGLLSGALGFEPALGDRLIGGVAGFGVLWLVATLYRRLRGRHGLGGGDPKMFGGIGLWLGWEALPLVLLVACGVGIAAVLALRAGGKRVAATDRMPLGVLLAAAAWAIWLGTASQDRIMLGMG